MSTRFMRLTRWLQQHRDWRTLAPRGGGLSARMVARRLLLPAYRTTFPTSSPEEDWLEEHEPQIRADLELARRTIDYAVDEARRLRVCVAVGDVADRVVRAMAEARSTGQRLSEMELETIASTYVANRPRVDRMLSREEFGRFQGLYDQAWRDEGAAHLAAHPYSRAMLGDDARPPLVRSRRENTWEALSRSVYSRFRLAARDQRVPGLADDIARAEVGRACGRLGLTHESALVVLYSLLRGLLQAPMTPRDERPGVVAHDRSWRQVPGPVSADATADGWTALATHGELTALAEATIETFCVRQSQGRYLRAFDKLEDAHQHAMRRAWMDCFKHDRRGHHIDAAEGAKIITIAIFKGIPSGEAYRKRRRDLIAAQPPGDDASPEGPGHDALNQAAGWFVAHPQILTGIIEGDPEHVEQYRRVAQRFQLPEVDSIMGFVAKENL